MSAAFRTRARALQQAASGSEEPESAAGGAVEERRPRRGKSDAGERLERAGDNAAAMGLPILLTVDETARLLRTTRRAIYVMAERRLLPGVTRIGRRMLIRSSDLLRWLDANRRAA